MACGCSAPTIDNSQHGILTKQLGKLTTDFFVDLLDMSTQWHQAGDDAYEGRDRKTNAAKWTATSVDLIFGSHSQLRRVCGGLCLRQLKGEGREGLSWRRRPR